MRTTSNAGQVGQERWEIFVIMPSKTNYLEQTY